MKSESDFVKFLEKIKTFDKNVIKGVGDDCAVLKFYSKNKYVVTTDTSLLGPHFTKDYTPEEIGYKSDNIKYIQTLYLAPGYIDHITYMMLADKLSPSSLIGDEPEDLEIIRVKISEINIFLDQQTIVDSRVYAAINYVHRNNEKL